MKTFIKKPEQLKAVQWKGDNVDEICELFDLADGTFGCEVDEEHLNIKLIEGGLGNPHFSNIPIGTYIAVDDYDTLTMWDEDQIKKHYSECGIGTAIYSDKKEDWPPGAEVIHKTRYKIWFRMANMNGELILHHTYTNDSIGDIQSGFWVNEVRVYDKGMSGKYWIPPSQIELVEKL